VDLDGRPVRGREAGDDVAVVTGRRLHPPAVARAHHPAADHAGDAPDDDIAAG